nr:MAG TPA: hypothetical protein [Caudoviricetes sp.]
MDINKRTLCGTVISRLSVLTFQRLTENEKSEERASISDLIRCMDNAGISFRMQNALFAVARSHDVRKFYLSQLLKIAEDQADETI